MARKKSFPHSTNASSNDKIYTMREIYGNDGYVFYFIILETIYKKGNHLDCSSQATMMALYSKLRIKEDKFKEMLETAFDIELFDRQAYELSNILSSKSIMEVAEGMENNRISLNPKAKRRIWKEDSYYCQYCGKRFDIENLNVDHIIPVSKGGTNDRKNLTTACKSCNQKKGNKLTFSVNGREVVIDVDSD